MYGSIQPTDAEGKSFTMTTLTQKKFECEDGAILKKLCDAIKASGNAMSNFDDALKHFNISPSSTLVPITSRGKAEVCLKIFF